MTAELTAVQRFSQGLMKIESAAVRDNDGKVWTLPRPARHDGVLRSIYEETGRPVSLPQSAQGFVTNCGRFLSRHQSLTVARKSGQVEGDLIGSVLTSEDLW